MTPPRWIVPLEHGPLAVGGPRIEISLGAAIQLRALRKAVRDAGRKP